MTVDGVHMSGQATTSAACDGEVVSQQDERRVTFRLNEQVGTGNKRRPAMVPSKDTNASVPESYHTRNRLRNKVRVREHQAGLMNQGATCYMNSLLQTLFMTSNFRCAVLKWDLPEDTRTERNIPYQLQVLFAKMMCATQSAVETKGLTKSFGWGSSECFAQHDVQELNRILFEVLQKYMQKLEAPPLITDLYEGSYCDFVECKTCSARRERPGVYQDVSLAIQGTKDLREAFDKFVETETMEGDNAVFCEQCNSNQPSLKGFAFKKFPPVLSVQLGRFGFDLMTLRREKVFDDVRIPYTINLAKYLGEPDVTERQAVLALVFSLRAKGITLPDDVLRLVLEFIPHHVYELFSVLAHRGTTSHGHYVSYIRPLDADRKWLTFNDDWVTPSDEQALLECLDPSYWVENYERLHASPHTEEKECRVSRSSPTDRLGVRYDQETLVVSSSTGAAAIAGIEVGDKIVEVDGTRVSGGEEFGKAMDEVEASKKMEYVIKVLKAATSLTYDRPCGPDPATMCKAPPGEPDPEVRPTETFPTPSAPTLADPVTEGPEPRHVVRPASLDDYEPPYLDLFEEGPRPSGLPTDSSPSCAKPTPPPPSSRMYPYMVVYRLRGLPHDTVSPEMMPSYLQEIVRREKEEFDDMLQQFNATKDLIEIKVYNGTDHFEWVVLNKEATLWETTLEAAALLYPGTDLSTFTPDTLRIRRYLETSKVGGRTIDGDHRTVTLAGAWIEPLTAYLLERRGEGDAPFRPLELEDISISLKVFDPVTKTFPEGPLPSITLYGDAMLGDLAESVSNAVGIPTSKLVLVYRHNMHTPEILVEPGQDISGKRVNYSLSSGEVVFCESVDDAYDTTSDPDLLALSGATPSSVNSVNTITSYSLVTVEYCMPGSSELSEKVKISSSATIGDLRAMLVAKHHFDPEMLIMKCGPNPDHGKEFKYPTRRLSSLAAAREMKVNLHIGKPLGPDDIAVECSLARGRGEMCQYLQREVVQPRDLLGDFKAKLAEVDAVKEAGITANNMRLRRGLPNKRCSFGGALIGNTWQDCLHGQTETLQVIIQKGTDAEVLAKNSLFLYARQFHPASGVVTEPREIVTYRGARVRELQAAIASLFEIDDQRKVTMLKVKEHQLQNPHQASWPPEPPQDEMLDRAVTGPPFKLDNDDMILFKCAERLPESSPSPSPSPEGSPKPSTGTSKKKESSKEKERGIVIRTEWDEPPTKAPEEDAGSNDQEGKDDMEVEVNSEPGDLKDDCFGIQYDQEQKGGPVIKDDSFTARLSQTFYDVSIMSDLSSSCALCLCDFDQDDVVVILECQDIFHPPCLAPWADVHFTCPVCREDISGA